MKTCLKQNPYFFRVKTAFFLFYPRDTKKEGSFYVFTVLLRHYYRLQSKKHE